jgi:hypothetical protein
LGKHDHESARSRKRLRDAVWKGFAEVSPPTGGGSEERVVPLPRKFFLSLTDELAYDGEF